jgi:hypothetical protein
MSGGGLDHLTTAQKRALLAERLRQRNRLTTAPLSDGSGPPRPPADPARGSLFDKGVIALASLKDWKLEEQDPFTRHVAPYKGFIYQHLGLDKTFVRGRHVICLMPTE